MENTNTPHFFLYQVLARGPDAVPGCEPATGRCPEPIRELGDQIQQGQETGQRIPEQVFLFNPSNPVTPPNNVELYYYSKNY